MRVLERVLISKIASFDKSIVRLVYRLILRASNPWSKQVVIFALPPYFLTQGWQSIPGCNTEVGNDVAFSCQGSFWFVLSPGCRMEHYHPDRGPHRRCAVIL